MITNTAATVSRQRISNSTIVAAVIALFGATCQVVMAQQPRPKTFPSANEAAQALYEAVSSNNDPAARAILGAGPELTSSGDETIDKLEHEQFAQKYHEMHRLVREPNGNTVLYIGAENWPFPIPLVAKNGKWQFDAIAGAREIAARRIGEDESIAIQVCQNLRSATQPNGGQNSTGDPALEFAHKLAANTPDADQPFHGYKFRIGSEQAVGVVLIAYPAYYGVSGVMTFIVVPGGSVYEKDLGAETAILAPQVNARPTKDWASVQ